jgi:hypothetical protein
MSLTKLAEKCQECEYKDMCDHKKCEAFAYIDKPITSPLLHSIISPAYADMAVKHDYRDIKIDTNTTITIDIEELKEELSKRFYREMGCTLYEDIF